MELVFKRLLLGNWFRDWQGRASSYANITYIHSLPLPQQLIPTSSSLLHLFWASLCYLIQLSGQLSVLWLAGNLPISLFLAQLHNHLSLFSLILSPGILRRWNLSNKYLEGPTCIRSALGSSGKSVPRSTPPGLPPQLYLPSPAAPKCI